MGETKMTQTTSKVGVFETTQSWDGYMVHSLDEAGLVQGKDWTWEKKGNGSRRIRFYLKPTTVEAQVKMSEVFWANNWMTVAVRYISPERLALIEAAK